MECRWTRGRWRQYGTGLNPPRLKELQRFLGFANFYRRFIAQYSQTSAPLTSLLRHKPKSLSWTPEAIQAFQHLKLAFCSAPALFHPNPTLRFVVEVDASTLGVGAVLSQWKGEPPVLHPCAYFSRKLSPAEQNYDIGDRELLAIKLALEEWRHWLEGAQHPSRLLLTIKTSNTYVMQDVSTTTSTVGPIFHPLPIHCNLSSRSQEPQSGCTFPPSSTRSIPGMPRTHSLSYRVCLPYWMGPGWSNSSRHSGRTCSAGRSRREEFVPTALRLALLDSVHSSPGSGHPGSQRTLSLLRNRYWWPNMARDVARYVKGCSVCAIASTPRRLPEGKLVPLPIPRRPWSHLGIDFATDLPSSNGFTTILVVIDCHEHQDSWSQYLPWAEYAQNSLRQETTGLTPFQCILGYQPPLFPWTGEPSEVPAVDYWFRESERVWDSAHIHLQQAVRRHKINADVRRTTAPLYRPGDQVWLSTRDIRLRLPCKKLSPRYIGPFPILRQINEVTYKLKLPNHYRISPTFHVSLLKPFTNPLLPPSTEPEIPPPPEVDTTKPSTASKTS